MKYTKYLLALAFVAVLISCSTTATANQTNAVSQIVPDKELIKLHKSGKSPLYDAKNRTEMGKFFSKDFVDLVWSGGSQPNLMNKLAIDGDLLLGVAGTSKSENESI